MTKVFQDFLKICVNCNQRLIQESLENTVGALEWAVFDQIQCVIITAKRVLRKTGTTFERMTLEILEMESFLSLGQRISSRVKSQGFMLFYSIFKNQLGHIRKTITDFSG